MTQFTHQFRTAQPVKRWAVYGIGALGFAPLVFMSREIVTGNFDHLAVSNADVLGSGSFTLFLSMLAITPLVTVTGQRWFAPLRWWFGVMFFATAAVDLVIASIVTSGDFEGGFLSRAVGHSFLLAGTTAVLLSVVLAATANKRSQRSLGKYWKPVQLQLTYAVWALILLHLLLLFGVGGGRFQQALFASAPLAALRLPPVRRWFSKGGRPWLKWSAAVILLAPFLWGYGHLIGEEINRGVNALSSGVHDA